ADRRRGVAADLAAQRGVPGERGTGRLGAGRGAAAHAHGAGKRQGSGARRGRGDRARHVFEGETARAGGAGERAIWTSGGSATGISVDSIRLCRSSPTSRST